MVATDSRWSWGRSLLWAVGLLVVTFLLAPILVIVGVSFNESRFLTFPPTGLSLQWYKALWQSRSWREAAQFSFWLALAVTAAALILGVPAAYALARGRFFGVRAVEFFLVSPMVMPVVVLAIGLYILFAPLRLVGTPFGLFLGHTLLAMPIVIVIAGG